MTFPILAPDPATNKKVNFLKYPINVGANRGRGQIYPTGGKSNNNIITSIIIFEGQITEIQSLEKGETLITVPPAEVQVQNASLQSHRLFEHSGYNNTLSPK